MVSLNDFSAILRLQRIIEHMKPTRLLIFYHAFRKKLVNEIQYPINLVQNAKTSFQHTQA